MMPKDAPIAPESYDETMPFSRYGGFFGDGEGRLWVLLDGKRYEVKRWKE